MSFSFMINNIGWFQIEKLSEDICKKHRDEILQLVNIIPYIEWTIDDLLSQSEDYYNNKWNYSYIVKSEKGNIIGVLI